VVLVKLLVSNNSELLRHLGSSSFRGLPLDVEVVTGGEAAAAAALRDRPALCILDAEMSDLSGYEA
jgi:CheY-like chemotaxis protein